MPAALQAGRTGAVRGSPHSSPWVYQPKGWHSSTQDARQASPTAPCGFQESVVISSVIKPVGV